MAEFTPNLNLYKWQISDEMEETFQQYRTNADKIDAEIFQLKNSQDTLWSGNMYLHGGQTITPTKNLSACRNGWILIWSDWDPGTNTVGDFDYTFSFIPKKYAQLKSGRPVLFSVPITQTATYVTYSMKMINITDTSLIGNEENASSTTNANDAVLRYVLEW